MSVSFLPMTVQGETYLDWYRPIERPSAEEFVEDRYRPVSIADVEETGRFIAREPAFDVRRSIDSVLREHH